MVPQRTNAGTCCVYNDNTAPLHSAATEGPLIAVAAAVAATAVGQDLMPMAMMTYYCYQTASTCNAITFTPSLWRYACHLRSIEHRCASNYGASHTDQAQFSILQPDSRVVPQLMLLYTLAVHSCMRNAIQTVSSSQCASLATLIS
eukprot:7621-Heterococcus_DN1.PRE.1